MKIIGFKEAVVTIDSRGINFNLTLIESRNYPIGPEVFVEQGIKYESRNARGCFEGTTNIVNCTGLDDLKNHLEDCTSDQAIVTGSPNLNNKWFESAKITWSIGDERLPGVNTYQQRAYYSLVDDFFAFRPTHPALLVFDVETICGDYRRVWQELTTIDPSLSRVGYLVSWSPFSQFPDKTSDESARHTERFRFYCIAMDGSDIPRYGATFELRRIMREEENSNPNFADGEILTPKVSHLGFAPGSLFFEGPALSSIHAKLPKTEIEVVHGEVLCTEDYPSLDCCEIEQYETLMSDLKNDLIVSEILARD